MTREPIVIPGQFHISLVQFKSCIPSHRGAFFPDHLTGRVNKARESIHNYVIVRFY